MGKIARKQTIKYNEGMMRADLPSTWEILPHVGIGPIRLGMCRDEARAAMRDEGWHLNEKATRMGSGVEHFGPNCPLTYELDGDGGVQFIEVSSWDVPIRMLYHGVNVFDTGARALFNLMAKHETSARHAYVRDEYLFPDQILTLWAADKQYDHRGGERRVVWATVGVGNARYVEACNGPLPAHLADFLGDLGFVDDDELGESADAGERPV